jgi:serine phosphatase RsbU (regulator of sigma subunit)
MDLASHGWVHGSGYEYATVVVSRWPPSRRTLTVCNAGNLPPYLIRDGAVTRIGDSGLGAGMFPGTRFNVSRVRARPGDIVLMTSDGIPDQPATDLNDFQVEELARHLASGPALSAEALLEESWRFFRRIDWK